MKTKIKTLWYKIGIKLFGDFFSRMFAVKTARQKKQRALQALQWKMKKQGVKEFIIDGKAIYARNKRNAERKAKRTN